jgi:hypothetical protein
LYDTTDFDSTTIPGVPGRVTTALAAGRKSAVDVTPEWTDYYSDTDVVSLDVVSEAV